MLSSKAIQKGNKRFSLIPSKIASTAKSKLQLEVLFLGPKAHISFQIIAKTPNILFGKHLAAATLSREASKEASSNRCQRNACPTKGNSAIQSSVV